MDERPEEEQKRENGRETRRGAEGTGNARKKHENRKAAEMPDRKRGERGRR
jgi:hypothetical protein